MHITELPTEIIEEILVQCDPIEVAKAAQTCSAFRTLIYDSQDSKLWRDLYLAEPLDDLRKCVSQHGQPAQVHWKRDLQRIIRAREIVANLSLLKPGELEDVLQTLLMMIFYHPPWSSSSSSSSNTLAGVFASFALSVTSLNLRWLSVILQHGFIDQMEEKMKTSESFLTFAERQLLSRLHCYYGLTDKDMEHRARVKSRVYVYTMRNYRPENDYGPLLSNGAVNWEHMQALHHVVSMHLVEFKEAGFGFFGFPSFPMSLPQMQIVIPVRPDSEEGEGKVNLDWVGLEGSWVISFCFCDHRDLLRFNEQTPLDTSMFEDPEFREVFRSLDVNLYLKRTEFDPAHPTTPVLYFFGEMQDPSTSTMTGRVRMSVDNQIRWHFISGDQGNAIWNCEGVQVGGLGSTYGILGSWSTIFHDIDDPVGPFWFRKYE